jgi:hypothetical protein
MTADTTEPKYCRCAPTGKREDGWHLDPVSGWWVHTECGLPSRLWLIAMVLTGKI